MALPDDAACKMARQYLEAIAQSLQPSELQNGDVVIPVDGITPSKIRRLRADLADVLSGEAERSARAASTAFGERFVQSVAFGEIDDFDLALKVGLLYSRRIVLWDILFGMLNDFLRWLDSQDVPLLLTPDQFATNVAQVAANILRAKPLVDAGALAMLPHPLHWSDNARRANRLSRAGRSGPFFGTRVGVLLSTTLAVTEELNVHPFSIDPTALPMWMDHGMPEFSLSRQNRLTQRTLTALFESESFPYLREVGLQAFFEYLSSSPMLSEELRILMGELNGLTEQQWRERVTWLTRRLESQVEASEKLETLRTRLGVGAPLVGAGIDAVSSNPTSIGSLLLALLGPVGESAAAGLEPTTRPSTVVAFLRRAQAEAEQENLVQLLAANPMRILGGS